MANEIQRRTEFHYYEMSGVCDMYLAAVCALQDYWKWLGKRGIDVEPTVACQSPELDFLVGAISSHAKIVRSSEGLTTDEFDQAVKFDEAIAYKLSLGTEKHVTQVFGMMVGSDPVKVVPDLSMLAGCRVAATKDLVLLPFPGRDAVAEFFANNHPELDVEVMQMDDVCEWGNVLNGRMEVAVRSGLTYLAASCNRAVLEIYPPDRHRNWLSKWTACMYQMIYGEPSNCAPELVYRAAEHLWQRVAQRQRAMKVPA